jgi:hypothetical protein
MTNIKERRQPGPTVETDFQPEAGYDNFVGMLEAATDWASMTLRDKMPVDQVLRVRFFREGESGQETLASTLLNRDFENHLLPVNQLRFSNFRKIISSKRGISFADYTVHDRGWIRAKLHTNDKWMSLDPPDEKILEASFFFLYRLLNSSGTFITLEKRKEQGSWEKICEPFDFHQILEQRKKEETPSAKELEETVGGIQSFGRTVFDHLSKKHELPNGTKSCRVWFRGNELGRGSWAEISVLVPLWGLNTIPFPLSYADSDLYHNRSIRRIGYDTAEGKILSRVRTRNEGAGDMETDLDQEILKKMWKMMRKKGLTVRVQVRYGRSKEWEYLYLTDFHDEWYGKLSPLEIGVKYKDQTPPVQHRPSGPRRGEIFTSDEPPISAW